MFFVKPLPLLENHVVGVYADEQHLVLVGRIIVLTGRRSGVIAWPLLTEDGVRFRMLVDGHFPNYSSAIDNCLKQLENAQGY